MIDYSGHYDLDAIRDSDGELPAYAWPGGYQMVYYTHDGLTICPRCANKTDTSDPATCYDVYWEGPVVQCDDCGEDIESAYGDPDDEILVNRRDS